MGIKDNPNKGKKIGGNPLKYTFVGDIHGKTEQVERALAKDGKIIFVGDFQDSFDRSVKDHEKCFQLVLAAIDAGKADALFGNHELSYIIPHHQCSGYQYDRKKMFEQFENEINSKFKSFILLEGNFLITHAGLHPIVLQNSVYKLDLESGSGLQEWANDIHSSAHWIGRYRRGNNPVGGIFWCDFKAEFEPIDGLNQIFGHTAGKGICTRHTETSKNFCIDCLDHESSFLELEI